MKLYQLLFAETKGPNQFTSPNYALIPIDTMSGKDLTLIHVETYKNFIKEYYKIGLSAIEAYPMDDWICSYGGITNIHKNKCAGALETNFMVASPKYPGAGSAMYAFISLYFNTPITSDRDNSSSNKAKKAWARIESDPSNWKKIELDSYGIDDDNNQKYFDSQGHWPNRNVFNMPEPKTLDKSDDCPLPNDSVNPTWINNKVGTLNAWIYIGPNNISNLLINGDQLIKELAITSGVDHEQQKILITKYSETLFAKYL